MINFLWCRSHLVWVLLTRSRAVPIHQVFKDTLVTLLRRHEIKEWNEQDQAELIASWSRMTGKFRIWKFWRETPDVRAGLGHQHGQTPSRV